MNENITKKCPVCGKIIKWFDRGRCKVCAKYLRKHGFDRVSLDMRKPATPKPRYIPAECTVCGLGYIKSVRAIVEKCKKCRFVEVICPSCGTIERKHCKAKRKECKRCQINENSRRYGASNTEKRKMARIKWMKKNVSKVLALNNRYKRRRRKTVHGVLEHRMEVNLRKCLGNKKQGKSWQSIVGYGYQELRHHIESQFDEGMSWELFFSGAIEIDHKIPKRLFKYVSYNDEQFKKCWALDNLQPLWKLDNRRKGGALYPKYAAFIGLQLESKS